MTSPNDPAFMVEHRNRISYDVMPDDVTGLTKREYFAAMAMQGLLASSRGSQRFEDIGTGSVEMADALIMELNR